MNRIGLISVVVANVVFAEDLAPADWKARAEKGDALVLDVRTLKEVANQGMIPNASVIDFNGGDFEKKVALISKDRPVLVYCASGGRSARAMELMTKLGFKQVSNLTGGFRAWQAARYPVFSGYTTAVQVSRGGEVTTPEAFDSLLKQDKRVLVDFQTPWCTPCQKMEPVFDALALEGVTRRKIDIDASEALAAREKIEGVPVFVLYVDGREKARLIGEQPKAALEALAR